ncbi:hypothetical protein AMTR_s00115p00084000, partial [Amborella trichopoda]
MIYYPKVNSDHTDIDDSVMYAKSVSEVWVDLHDQFSQKNAPRIVQICRGIATLQQ